MRTLDDIIPPSKKKTMEPLAAQAPREPMRGDPLPYERPPRFPYATLIAILLVIAASVGALFYFSSAKVEVVPNSVTAEIQGTLTATKSTGDLPFEMVTMEKIASQSVKGSGTKNAVSSASGMITIYNTRSEAQRLIANTRFASPAGLIYRIREAVTIPGGTQEKPGTLSVKVYADQSGASYNIGPANFTIPGFSGSVLATQVYAKSTSAMTGGASGAVPVVDSALEAQTKKELGTALARDLEAEIGAKVPEGYLLIPGAAKITFTDLAPEASATTGMVEVRMQGSISAVVFPNAVLAKAVASSVTGLEYQGEPVMLTSASTLKLEPERAMPGPNDTSFTFRLSGNAALEYVVDPTRIQAAISGKTRSAAEVALTNYTEVKRAMIILRPFWRQTFPQDPSIIDVDIVKQ